MPGRGLIVPKAEILFEAPLPDGVDIDAERQRTAVGAIEPLAADPAEHRFQHAAVHAVVLVLIQSAHMGQLQHGHGDLGRGHILPDVGPHARQFARRGKGEFVVVVDQGAMQLRRLAR